jgi:hypothetical protein
MYNWVEQRSDPCCRVCQTLAPCVLLQSNLDKPFFVWGEDALLKWPGAEPALIAERDAFMARVLAATATGTNSNAPAFVSEEVRLNLVGLTAGGSDMQLMPKGSGQQGALLPNRS